MGLRKTEISLLLVQHWPASDRQHGSQAARLESSHPRPCPHIRLRACVSKWLLHTPHQAIPGCAELIPTTPCYSPRGQTRDGKGGYPRVVLLWLPCISSCGSVVDFNFQGEGMLLWVRGEQAWGRSTKPWETGTLCSTGQGIRSDQTNINGSQA